MTADREHAIREKGLEIFRLMEKDSPRIFDRKWWAGRVMELAMESEELKVQLFRFVDVFPTLSSPDLVARHIREYFLSEGSRFPALVRTALTGATSAVAAPLTTAAFRKEIEEISRNFIAGDSLGSARNALKTIWEEGRTFTVDLLGEVAVSEKEAETYCRRYQGLVEDLSTEMGAWRGDREDRSGSPSAPRLNVSVKISSLYSRIGTRNYDDSVRMLQDRLRPIFRAVRDRDGVVNLDMESYDLRTVTYDVFTGLLQEKEFEGWDGGAVAVQAYMKEAMGDLRKLLGWAREQGRKITVRLVKGAYWEHEVMAARQRNWPVPVFEKKSHTDWNFERCTALLFDNTEWIVPAIASHNVRSIAQAMVCAAERNIPRWNYEFQMLYGMAEPIKRALAKMGHSVREYVPVGELVPGMAYLVRRLLENTSNEGFLRKRFAEDADTDALLLPPLAPAPEEDGGKEKAEPETPRCDLSFSNEAVLDLTREENRKRWADELKGVTKRLGASYPLFIGGREYETKESIVSTDPAGGRVVGKVSVVTRELADRAIAAAAKARAAWEGTSPADRAAVLFGAADIARTRRPELAAWQIFEAGKNLVEADADVCEAIDMLEYYGRETIRLGLSRKLGDAPGEDNRYRYRPRGLGLVIAPWNFPLAISVGMTAASLAAGNAVLYKPSSLTPVNGWMMCELFRSAGLPDGVLNFIPGPGDLVGEYLVPHPAVDFIAFTGSRDVGCRIIEKAAAVVPGQKNIRKVIAEMGGKNAIVVDADADLDAAVLGVVQSAFGYQGQKCSACSRAIVVGAAYDRFVERLGEAVRSIAIGPPEDPKYFMGPVIDGTARDKILGYIETGKTEGRCIAEIPVPDTGFYVSPTVFVDLKDDSRLLKEEIFGPVLCVMKARDMDEAIRMANDSDFALTGGLYSRSPGTIKKATREFRAGNLYINRGITGAIVGRQPFGGFGMSGVGSKAGGPDYLQQFMEPQVVTENTARRGFAPELMA